MSKFFLIGLLTSFSLFSNAEGSFDTSNDPAINHHVNVISGKLQLSFQDHVVQGAVPIALERSYTTYEVTEEKHQRWNFSEGWSFFSHTHLYVSADYSNLTATIIEPSGGKVTYKETKKTRKEIFMQSDVNTNGNAHVQSYRENVDNNLLHFDRKHKTATLHLANGGKRIYQPSRGFSRFFEHGIKGIWAQYLLVEEISPSGGRTLYHYSEDKKKLTVSKVNPSGDKVFSKIEVQRLNYCPDFKIRATCGDGKVFNYSGVRYTDQPFLSAVCSEGRQKESIYYVKDSETEKVYLSNIHLNDTSQFAVSYYLPEVDIISASNSFVSHGKSVSFHPMSVYKVKEIFEGGIKTASFTYDKNVTSVRDCENILTKYYHKDGALLKIERFDKRDQLYSTASFIWENGNLAEKQISSASGALLYSKKFVYDESKNLIKQSIEGGPTKYYSYNERHLLIKEEEENGLTSHFEYLPDTDLIMSKKIECNGKVYLEESYYYDQDLLLIEKKTFDGYRECRELYIRDPHTGLIIEKDNGLQKTFYEYDSACRVTKESSEFATISTEYDANGRISCKTFPLGAQNTYAYDIWGNTIEVKEVGFPRKYITYDRLHRPIKCRMGDRESKSVYDIKGRIISEIDYKGVETKFAYDSFGRCIKKTLPMVHDEMGDEYHPEILYQYDIAGNCIAETGPDGLTSRTKYNVSGKPVEMIFADGSSICNHYNKYGDLCEVVDLSGKKTVFTYDPLHRITSSIKNKHEHSQDDYEFKESWEYEGQLLKSYTDSRGLVTQYLWDEFGRKIAEIYEGRKKEFFYNKQGFLVEEKEAGVSTFQQFDIEGRIIETSQNGFNKISYEYDEQGRKSKAIKITSKGEAVDQFFYDDEGELILHIDPMGERTEILYDGYERTTIDPLENRFVETFDRLNRLIQTEKQNPQGETLLQENFLFDRSGNIKTRLTKDPCLEVSYNYDLMGRVIEQIEAGKKHTIFEYNKLGQITKQTDPNGTSIYRYYDDYDRLTAIVSSDGSLSYRYTYNGFDIIEIRDEIKELSLYRTYTKFGEIATETSFSGFKTSWYYDTYGRKKSVVLPDESSIDYSYEDGFMTAVMRKDHKGKLQYSHCYTKFDANHHVEEETLPLNGGYQKSARDMLERAYLIASPVHKIELDFNAGSLISKQKSSLTGDKDYQYDALSQLIKEGEKEYHFDSIGNSKEYEIDDLNQIISKDFDYDANGNMLRQNEIAFKYDVLNRLIEIHSPDKDITYTYDPLNRLAFKVENGSTTNFLYDGNSEIGTISQDGTIDQLKVLGLGLLGDIGAAIAIEISGEVYIPLHDLQGNIIGIINKDGQVVESYHTNAFGEQKTQNTINPWKFSSKRSEQHLIFFGCRFYEPSLKRWLTPDPLGFIDSRNPYAYVRASPLNRLDEFGLYSDYHHVRIPLSLQQENSYNSNPDFMNAHTHMGWNQHPSGAFTSDSPFFGSANIGGRNMDMMLSFPANYEFHFTDEEKKQGYFNLYSRLPDLFEGVVNQIAFFTYQNGIKNDFSDFLANGQSIIDKLPVNSSFFAIHTPTKGIAQDLRNTRLEKKGIPTDDVFNLIATYTMLFDIQQKVAPTVFFEHEPHSRACGTFTCAFENSPERLQRLIIKNLYCDGIGGAKLIPKKYGINSKNYYSKKDYVTKWSANNYDKNDYNVTWLEATTPKEDRILNYADHSLLGATYQGALTAIIKECKLERGGIYEYKNRR